ncbi:MAG: class I SAM-dependent methyltransferase [Lachnospiraceae bacterium]|nr:class I SAM-dependent methyltransferase [Lachnospiraceae bacterium]
MENLTAEEAVTRSGNPRKPEGEDGAKMLQRMNQSHSGVTGWALPFLKLQGSDQVLDIGCGGGATLRSMSRQIRSGHLTGVDYSPVSVQVSRDWNAEDIQNGRMEVLEASVERLPFADESFDKIITVESFYFWPNPAENLREVLRVLKKGGLFLLVADIYQKEGLSERAAENIRRYQMFNPTKEEFEKLFKEAGFAAVGIHTKEGEDWICIGGIR